MTAGDPFPGSHDWDALEDAAALLADAKPDALVFNAGKGAAIRLAQDRGLTARYGKSSACRSPCRTSR